MSGGSVTDVKVGEVKFDLAAVGQWVSTHPWLAVLFVLIGYFFLISMKGGLLSKLIDYRLKRRELEARIAIDQLALTQKLEDRYKMDESVKRRETDGEGL